MNKKIIALSVLIAILFVGSIAGTIFYYNGVVNNRDSRITNLNREITTLNSQISTLTEQVANLASAYLVTALGMTEIKEPAPYSYLIVEGSVTNIGLSTAYNAGLHVVAYTSTGILEINMTVPLDGGNVVFGANATISHWLPFPSYDLGSLQLGNLGSNQTDTVDLNIFHAGTVSNYTLTPVWTNSP